MKPLMKYQQIILLYSINEKRYCQFMVHVAVKTMLLDDPEKLLAEAEVIYKRYE